VTPRQARPERLAAGGAASGASDQPLVARFEVEGPLDLRLTLGPLRHGGPDPTIRFRPDGVWLARRTEAGAATLHLSEAREGADCVAVVAEAWGPGATLAVEAVPGLAGLLDQPELLIPRHPLIAELTRRFPGLRLTRTGQLLTALIPAVLGQKVTAIEMIRGNALLLARLGEPAPGPGTALGLRVPPSGARLSALPYFELHSMGVERRRADVLRRVGARETSIEALMRGSPAEASARLQSVPGVGPWTAAEACRLAFGDPDAISLGDAHTPDLVAWALAGEPRADDDRMVEILAPYPGQRARVVALLEAARIGIPRFGPRFSPRRIDRI
jgi:3-methyladenine DNA glycosylase/8-oxoguanine DNA glycosylase